MCETTWISCAPSRIVHRGDVAAEQRMNLVVTGVIVPVLAVLVATVFAPTRLPLTRRVT